MVARSLFLLPTFAACALVLPGEVWAATDTADARHRDTVRIVVVVSGDSTAADFRRGIELGIAEARALSGLLGRHLESWTVDGDDSTLRLPSLVSRSDDVSAVVSFQDSLGTVVLARQLEAMAIPLINAGTRSDALRRSMCSAVTFHVSPSEAMLHDGAAQIAGPERVIPEDVVAWLGSLERFGAGELNDRYRSKFGVSATEHAWLAWLSIKLAAESALRAQSARGKDVLAYLTTAAPRFDGHKGKPLTFRAWDRQLRQPLYVVVRDPRGVRTIEVPMESTRDKSAAAQLDALGDGPEKSRCQAQS